MSKKARSNGFVNDSNEERFVLAPASIPQEQFLSSTSTITCYSGAMGAGKTFAIILNMVKFASMQNSTIAYFRRTVPELRMPGGVWQEASGIFRKMFPDVKIRDREMTIFVPSTNSLIKFGSLQHISDVQKALGSQFSVIIFDEAVTFEPFEEFILPLLGRLRNASVSYEPQMLWATNPKYDHGIYHWLKDFYLDEHGIPFDEKSNIERWFILKNSKPIWFDSKEDAEVYCKENFPHQKEGEEIKPRSFRSIKAHVTHNVKLMKANPGYIANLYAMPEIKRRIYLDGSWTAREEEAGFFRREFCKIVNFSPMDRCNRVRSWDQSSSLPSSAKPDPDWTRGVLVSKTKDSIYTIEDLQSLRDRPMKVEELILETARNDPEGTVVVLSVDPGSSGIAYANALKVRLAEIGVSCKLARAGRGSKLTRFLPVSAISEAGLVQVVKADWNEDVFEELERFNGEKNNGHDDIADALSDAVYILNQGKQYSDFTMSDLTSRSTGVLSTAPSFLQYNNQNAQFSIPTFNL